jgi:hypothetical protein
MKNTSVDSSVGDAIALMRNLFDQSAQFGTAILGVLSKGGSFMALPDISKLNQSSGCCDIPPPCWEPQPLGEVTSFVAAGGKATVRFRITNCGFTSRTITVVVAKPVPALTFSPASLTLGPMERGVISASFEIGTDAKKGFEEELVLFVRGCRNYYLRWIITVADCGVDMCNEIEVNDCPDMIHHWYDHFYCPRHCQEQRQPGITGITPVITPATITPNVAGGG